MRLILLRKTWILVCTTVFLESACDQAVVTLALGEHDNLSLLLILLPLHH